MIDTDKYEGHTIGDMTSTLSMRYPEARKSERL